MKNYKFFLGSVAFLMAMLTMTEANAQVRRTKTTRRSTVRTNTTPQKSIAKKQLVKTIACIETKADAIAMGNKYVYYLEKGENNAVIGINRQTGEKETIIPGIAGIYEDARPRIYKIFASGDKLFFYIYTRDDFDKVYMYDGKSIESSPRLTTWGRIIETTANRAVIVSTNYQYELWDTENMKMIVNYGGKQYEKGKDLPAWEDRNPNFIISSDDAVWREGSKEHMRDICRIGKDGQHSYYNLEKEEYMAKNELRGYDHMTLTGDTLYVSAARRLYRMSIFTPGKWEEYAKIPVNENKIFARSYVDSKGNVMTRGDDMKAYGKNYNIEYYKADALDTPIALGESNFKSGLDVWDRTAIWWSLCRQIMVDSYDNFLFFNDSGVLYVYNPNGVVGYTKAIGQVIK